jgi:hypothetical protein
MRESHDAEKQRRYHGEEDAADLITWLNSTEDVEGRERIQRIIYTAMQIWSLGHKPIFNKPSWRIYKNKSVIERLRLETELNDQLSYYQLVPSFLLLLGTEWHFWWRAAPGSKLAIRNYGSRGKRIEDTKPGEVAAIKALLQVLWSGNLVRVGRCKCKNVFFRKFTHQEFCSDRCRNKARESSEEWKEYRRKKAREYYRLHKSGKVK